MERRVIFSGWACPVVVLPQFAVTIVFFWPAGQAVRQSLHGGDALPPVVVVFLMQRWFVRGLVEAEK